MFSFFLSLSIQHLRKIFQPCSLSNFLLFSSHVFLFYQRCYHRPVLLFYSKSHSHSGQIGNRRKLLPGHDQKNANSLLRGSQVDVSDGNRYDQTFSDGKCLCPNRTRFKHFMSRLWCIHQTFFRSCPDFCAIIFRRSCSFRCFQIM